MTSTKEIELTRGKVALVDDADYESLMSRSWCASPSRLGAFYARRGQLIDGKHVTILMHRQILHAPHGLEVDHRNGNTLDNRRANLRLATSSENKCNAAMRSHNTSGFRGVTWSKSRGMWQAQIGFEKKRVVLGYFASPVQAAIAYNAAAVRLHGQFARLNDPDKMLALQNERPEIYSRLDVVGK